VRSLKIVDVDTDKIIAIIDEDDVAKLLGYYTGIEEFESWLIEGVE